MGNYDIALVCQNGHVINASANRYQTSNAAFCAKCGEKTINSCDSCNKPIRGKFHSEGLIDMTAYKVPSYCMHCGSAYPWTKRAIDAAKELIRFSELNEQEQQQFGQDVQDLVAASPRTSVAQIRVKKFLSKAGKEITEGIKNVLVDMVSESVKKFIWD